MNISPLFRVPVGIHAYAGVAPGTSPRAGASNAFQSDFKARTHAANQPIRFSSGNVALANRAVQVALHLMRSNYPVATQLRAVRLLSLAYAVLRSNRQPASAASSSFANGHGASAFSNFAKSSSKARQANPGPSRTEKKSSAEESKRANTETVRAQSNTLADAFKVLGLPATASAAEAKKAYHKAALKHHPDKFGNAEKFKVLNNAYAQVKLHFENARQ
jgi:hypothetical protein